SGAEMSGTAITSVTRMLSGVNTRTGPLISVQRPVPSWPRIGKVVPEGKEAWNEPAAVWGENQVNSVPLETAGLLLFEATWWFQPLRCAITPMVAFSAAELVPISAP